MTTKLAHKTPVEQHREKVLHFWQEHGFAATKDAYDISRSTLFLWQKRLRIGRLAADSRKPKNFRKPEYSRALVKEVTAIRAATGYGKEKLTQILRRDYSRNIAESTVGRIIKKYKLPKPAKQTKPVRTRKKIQRLRKPKDFIPQKPGELVGLDTIVLHWFGLKFYVIVAIDWFSRVAVAHCYTNPSSKNAADLLQRMQLALGVKIQAVNTDNGSEFLKNFISACNELEITHYFNYPRCPKMNAITERFNRTLQEEVVWPDPSSTLTDFNHRLNHFLFIYNFYRPHHSLSNQTPVEVFLAGQSNMYWTHTRTSKKPEFSVK
jgi:transposase InsO family protein